MSIFSRIVSKLRDIVRGIREEVGEARERLEERRAASLAEKLDELAKTSSHKNWRVSIEDLVYLAGQDGSYDGRKALWDELECEGEYEGSGKQNIALHKRFLERLPSEGIPWPKAK
jgi:hypothetical protein